MFASDLAMFTFIVKTNFALLYLQSICAVVNKIAYFMFARDFVTFALLAKPNFAHFIFAR